MSPSTFTLLTILTPLASATPIPTPSSPPQPPPQPPISFSLSALAWPLLIYDVFSLVALLWAWRRGVFSHRYRIPDPHEEGTRERWERWAREEEVMRRLGVLG